jgi:hypothetical protein
MRRLYRKRRFPPDRRVEDDEQFGDDENPFLGWSPFGDKDCGDNDVCGDDKASP